MRQHNRPKLKALPIVVDEQELNEIRKKKAKIEKIRKEKERITNTIEELLYEVEVLINPTQKVAA